MNPNNTSRVRSDALMRARSDLGYMMSMPSREFRVSDWVQILIGAPTPQRLEAMLGADPKLEQ